MVKTVNAMKKKEETAPAEPAAPAPEVVLLGEIRDLLMGKK
jgi:large conductance mechanosensitive channel